MSRAEFVCPICRASVLAPASLAGASALCPKCRAPVPRWPEPRQKPVSAPPALAPAPSYPPNSGTAVHSESDGAAGAMVEKHAPAVNFTALIGAAVLFLLPWTNIHCNGRQLGTQTGLQAVIGDVTPAENIKHFQLGETKNSTPNPEKEIRPALLVGLAGLLTLAGVAAAALTLFAHRASSVRPEVLAAVALGLLLIQSAVGFPVNDTLFKNRKGTDGRTPESEVASLAVDLRADRTVWFYFALCFLAAPPGLYAYRFATSANVSRRRSAPPETHAPRSTAGAADLNDAQRLLLKRTALVVGGLFVLVVLCAVAWAVSRRDGGANGPPSEPVVTSMRELRPRAEWEVITITGRVGLASRGIDDWIRIPGEAPPAKVAPLLGVTLSDGTRIQCAFQETPANAFDVWVRRNPPGTMVTIRGTFTGPELPILLTGCELLSDGFGR